MFRWREKLRVQSAEHGHAHIHTVLDECICWRSLVKQSRTPVSVLPDLQNGLHRIKQLNPAHRHNFLKPQTDHATTLQNWSGFPPTNTPTGVISGDISWSLIPHLNRGPYLRFYLRPILSRRFVYTLGFGLWSLGTSIQLIKLSTCTQPVLQ